MNTSLSSPVVNKKYRHCLVIGKFMPPHKGHEYMIRFAQQWAQSVHVVVDCVPGQSITPELRAQWLNEQINGIKTYALKQDMPQEPSEGPHFWPTWKSTLLNTLGFKPDVVVAAMDYGWELTRQLECQFIPIDIARESIPISATQLRHNVYEHWDYLVESARPHYVKKVCVLGPESTGKSLTAQKVASQLNTIYVPEYAKALIEKQKGEFFLHNVEQVALAQVYSEQALSKFARKILVCDSSAITTKIYANLLFGQCPETVQDIPQQHLYDKYVLFYPDSHTPYAAATHREALSHTKDERLHIFSLFEQELKNLNVPYEVIYGSYEQREQHLFDICSRLILA